MMSHCGIRQQIRFVRILFSLRWYVELILQSRTLSLCSKSSIKYSEEEPALQCRRQSARRTSLQRRRVRRVYCLRRCKAGSPSNFMFLSNSVRLPYKCCAPWLPRPIMAFFHVSYECEKLGYFYILPPSRANELPIREARI